MSWNMDGTLDPDEALRLLEHMSGDSDNDFVMLIENKGNVVEGESGRAHEDGKQRMDVAGYAYLAEVVTPPGSSKGKVRNNAFIVVRRCDAATASIASLMKNQDSDIKVQLSVFKAGGDNASDMQPTLEFVLEGARVDTHSILTGGRPKQACEIVFFHFRKIEIRSAPQVKTGLRGAVRSCLFS
ncbi:MAG: type VI secretion system tube protein Hcp [Gammaproteobacteria bacterium]|nr:type VI secretion system tube protein Hcp [Gammaproteobacteria bacterium]MBU1443781.1 type VI secretion system tube protein Hcp [Gammaproteobacteria bacterium]MBU2286160.1 type VI secretion system tube protein Hcp [Gammaproteobacteria bacterium]MBU2409063.1 type VI secretion system tube protein Hcp [Gammaproteobacteria bacterium]